LILLLRSKALLRQRWGFSFVFTHAISKSTTRQALVPFAPPEKVKSNDAGRCRRKPLLQRGSEQAL